MKLCLNVSAYLDTETDSTRLRCRVHEVHASTSIEPATVLFERDLEVVWGDRHSIQVRNAARKALEHFAAREEALRAF